MKPNEPPFNLARGLKARALSSLKETQAASALRYAYWRKNADREHSYVQELSRRTRSNVLNVSEFGRGMDNSGSSTFFILGNGASINELATPAWEHIAKHSSVGLNAWPLHPFVPSYFSFEFGADTIDLDPELEWLVKRAEEKSNNQSTRALFLRPPSSASPLLLEWLTTVFPEKKMIYGRSNLSSRDSQNISPDLRRLFRKLKGRHALLSVLPDNGSSVVRMISAGLLAGFSEIVLSGVDMNEGPYFWFEDEFLTQYGDFRERCPRAIGAGTLTLSNESRPFSTQEFIGQLQEVARSEFGARITVTSENSNLYPTLDIYSF